LTKAEFIAVLRDPHLIDTLQMSGIEKLIGEYPYCATLHGLYTKALQNNGSLDFDKQLTLTSLLYADRNALYKLCYQQQLQGILSSVEDKIVPLSKEKPTQEHIESDEVISAETTIPKDIATLPVRDELLQELEKNILLEAINQSIARDVEEEIELLVNESDGVDENLQDVIQVHDVLLESSTKVSDSAPKKFSDWLLNMKPITKDVVQNTTIEESEKRELASPQSLIDRFLQLEDTSIKVKKEPTTPQDLAKLSLVENEEFVTETLANIYAVQGNYSKSIKIYEQLILKIPEKKTFFASRIRFLREKMEYDK
jgi:tetratricopeptide (TPR) repeat protein